jgi:hypothetical protein
MQVAGTALQGIAGLGMLVCFILVLIKIFQDGQTGLGIACIVLTVLCCGIGGLIAFVVGWINHRRWNITPVMIVWTVCCVLDFVGFGMSPIDISQIQQQFQGAR